MDSFADVPIRKELGYIYKYIYCKIPIAHPFYLSQTNRSQSGITPRVGSAGAISNTPPRPERQLRVADGGLRPVP